MEGLLNLCRCCLAPESEISLFDEELNTKEKFLETTSLEVQEDDDLPQKLCSECYQSMTTAYQFRQQCIKMDAALKTQIQALIREAEEIEKAEKIINDANSKPIKQVEAIIKSEPPDSDDEYYYVLVIDDTKEKDKDNKVKQAAEIIKEVTKEVKDEHLETTLNLANDFGNSIDSFLVSDKVPINVPATILENEEESFDPPMDIDDDSQDMDLIEHDTVEPQDNVTPKQMRTGVVKTIPHTKKYIKIVTANGTEGTIFLKGADGQQLAYLTDSQLTDNDLNDGEVIVCEGDDSIQYVKCEGSDMSDLVIEYTDESQIATVLQQEDGTFLCDCGEQFEDLTEYEKHQYTHNPGGENLCKMCGKGFESPEILTGHMLLHNVTGLLVMCPFCNELIRRNALTQHIKYGHNNIKPRCQVCFKTFANANNLKRHMMIHTGIKLFECDICFKRFHQKITMQTHRLTHIAPFTCIGCEKVFENKTEFDLHKDTNECDNSKINKIREELTKSLKQTLKNADGEVVAYSCTLCKNMFSLQSAFEQHVETSHMVDPMELLCTECGDVLPSKREMQSHIITHKHAKMRNMKRFDCSVCGKGCASQAMLVMHERVHTNERPFACHLCTLKFKTKTHLRTHQLTHTREKKFGCSVCMKFFALKGNLVVHLRTHTGERPYVCNLCEDAFIDSKYLKKHKLKKHAIENVPWNKY